ncbi:YeeE/YedE family protein [Dyella amyloliquefaciens]|uniref:YeeE/YedE family protein n=1 Tax=Dyella amyloliquefaciens TaxID=1770545 RepID=UPI001E58596D|nr:YeeE/YedE family protein [Dyella amyloliquefaciens]
MNVWIVTMHPWLLSALGGILIGLSAVLLMGSLGRIAGISGIASGLVTGAGDRGWRIAFVVGLVAAPWLLQWLRGDSGIGAPPMSWPWMAGAGLLVGFGTRLGGGCTSGHGVCGMARLSPRSLLATLVFMLMGVVTVFVVRHLLGVVGP